MPTVITFGTFDLFHVGHLNILNGCRKMAGPGGRVVVGVSSDALNKNKKSRLPTIPEAQRMAIVSSVVGVSDVFIEESLELKQAYIDKFDADILVMGDDWKGRFDGMSGCRVLYLPRTKGVSTTDIRDRIIRAGSKAN